MKTKVFQCRKCEYVGITYSARCPSCNSEEYKYYSQEIRR